MKKKSVTPRVRHEPDEELVREYAQHLYEQSGCIPGHDLDNWLEAEACLEANIPREMSHRRLQRHLRAPEPEDICEVPIEAHNVSS